MLYDLSKDPQENRNVAGDPKYAGTIAMMKNRLSTVRLKPHLILDPQIHRLQRRGHGMSHHKLPEIHSAGLEQTSQQPAQPHIATLRIA